MTRRLLMVILALPLGAAGSFAQDPLKVAPQAYRLQFENEWVKVIRVHYEPREKIAAHDHPTGGTVFVYLEDGGPVRFSHVGAEPYAIERPAILARGYRIARPVSEHHEVENLSDLPNDFLRVEMKTEPVDVDATRGRFPPPPVGTSNSTTIERDSAWVRTARITVGGGQSYDAKDAAPTPSLVVAFGPVDVKGSKGSTRLALGDTLWVEPGTSLTYRNAGSTAVEVLRIDLRSKPSSTWSPDVKGHDHR